MSSNPEENTSKRASRNTRSNSLSDLTLDTLKTLLGEQKQEIILSLSSKVDELNSKVTDLISRIKHLENIVTSVSEKQEEQQEEIDNLKELVSSTANPESLLDEIQQRLSRANNVVVSGLPEKTSGSVVERTQQDLLQFKRLTEFLDISDVCVTHCTRVGGTRQDGNRLLKVKLMDPIQRAQLLRKSKSLRNTEFGKVYINPDLTPTQQSKHKELRRELRERRQMGEDVVIYRGSIRPKSALKNFHR